MYTRARGIESCSVCDVLIFPGEDVVLTGSEYMHAVHTGMVEIEDEDELYV